mgnify:CR=1 FL=1
MTEPPLVTVCREAVEKMSYRYVCAATGEEVGENFHDPVLVDVQTANVVVQCYDALKDKSKFQAAIDNAGVIKVVEHCWGAVTPK